MGHIKRLFAMEEIEPRSVTPNMIWTDLCENVHLHYRNIRFDFSEKEFAAFRAAMNALGMAVEHTADKYDYREGDPNFLVQQKFKTILKTDSDYYPNRILIELQKDNTVHFHYRDLRLHWTLDEFKAIAEAFIRANHQFTIMEDVQLIPKDSNAPERMLVALDKIQPYDEGHRPGVIDAEHREGIDFCKQLIKDGQKIRPILVDSQGQRLDGFKRYMAHLELGKKQIECIVDPFGKMGGQNNQSMLDTDDLAEYACDFCGQEHLPTTPGATPIRWECKGCGLWNELKQ